MSLTTADYEALDAIIAPLEERTEREMVATVEALRATPIDLVKLDTLLAPLESHCKAVADGLEARAQRNERADKLRESKLERQWWRPEEGDVPRDWDAIRVHPEVAPLIEDGWRISHLEPGEDGYRWAELVRTKREWLADSETEDAA